jgi:hypothetical protein
MTCNCHPESPFLWYKNKRPSIFVEQNLNQYSLLSQKQSAVVERERQAGRDIAHIPGLSKASNAQRILDVRRFTIYSKA